MRQVGPTTAKQDPSSLSEDSMREGMEAFVLNCAAEGIFGCDSEGTCLFCNPAAVQLLGYSKTEDLLGQNMHALEHHTRKDGTPFPIEECPIYLGLHEN